MARDAHASPFWVSTLTPCGTALEYATRYELIGRAGEYVGIPVGALFDLNSAALFSRCLPPFPYGDCSANDERHYRCKVRSIVEIIGIKSGQHRDTTFLADSALNKLVVLDG